MSEKSKLEFEVGMADRIMPTLDASPSKGAEPAAKSLLQEVRERPKVTAYCFGLSVSILLLGFDSSIVSTVAAMPQFQRVFGEYHESTLIIPALWLSLWNGVFPIGAMAGAASSGLIQDRFGRRASVCLGSYLTASSVFIYYFSDAVEAINGRRGLFLFAKLFQGHAVGLLVGTTQTYVSENLTPALRGPLLALSPIFTVLGQLIGGVVIQALLGIDGPNAYRFAFATQWVFAAVPLTLSFFVPESPHWLIRQGRIADAMRSFRRLGSAGTGDVDIEFESMLRMIREEQDGAGAATEVSYSHCFKGVASRRTFIAIFAGVIPAAFGLPLLGSVSYFFPILGMEVSTAITLLIVGTLLGMLASICSFWTLGRFGRRTLMLYSLTASAVLWAGVGIAGFFNGPVIIWYSAVSMILIIVIVGLGAWPASVVVGAEASSLELRAKTMGLAGVVSNMTMGGVSIGLPYLYNPDSGNLAGKTALVFVLFSGVSVAATWLAVPEMKGRTVAEIDEMFELQLPARAFADWRKLKSDMAE